MLIASIQTQDSMTRPSETRHSLIARLKDPADQAAWEEFVIIYRPTVYRVAIQKGLQAADAEDVVQTVLISVSKAVENWKPDPSKAKFRTWLNRIAHNAAINALTRRKPDRGSGGTHGAILLSDQSEQSSDSRLILLEQRRESFRIAASQIKDEFQESTWQAFWLSSIEEVSIDEVSERLGKSVGNVYAARSRVMKRLQERVREMMGREA
jgi:RNA polymerase sigma-70 factor (ECF subfamily)